MKTKLITLSGFEINMNIDNSDVVGVIVANDTRRWKIPRIFRYRNSMRIELIPTFEEVAYKGLTVEEMNLLPD